jgi:hypothetical protein
MPKHAKFHGKLKDLIPYGFKFRKAFAANYRCYTLMPKGEYSDWITVWQHHGGYVELQDCFSFSYLIFNYILSGLPKPKFNQFAINMVTEQLEPFDYSKHQSTGIFVDMVYRQKMDENDPRIDQAMEHYSKTYRVISIEDETWEAIEKLGNLGWLKITN